MGPNSRLRRDRALDAGLALLADPYRYVSRRCDALGTDLFETRLLLRTVVCMRGADAARLFYDPEKFVRDGEIQHDRKAIFQALIEQAPIGDLVARFVGEWERAAPRWAASGPIRLYPEIQALLTRAACGWAGLPLAPGEEALRIRQLAELFDHAGARGPAHLRARLARIAADRWAAGLIRRARRGEPVFRPGSPAELIAAHRYPGGALLEPKVAGVELLNLLRPTVAVSVYILLIAHALALHPPPAASLAEPRYRRAFVDEVRRFYPFFPALMARVRQDFEWRGAAFTKGRRVLLDLYGTNHHPDWWELPESFRPERFLGLAPNPWSFIPQGGGVAAAGHLCPGDGITIALMEAAVELLARRMRYTLPPQDLSLDFRRMPALPRSKVVIDVKGMA